MSSGQGPDVPDWGGGQVATRAWTQGSCGRSWGFWTADVSLGDKCLLGSPGPGAVSTAAVANRGRGGAPWGRHGSRLYRIGARAGEGRR